MADRTVNQILRDAFREIQEKHDIAVTFARFELFRTATADGKEHCMVQGIEFEAVAMRGAPEDLTAL